jgi:membrane protein YdbS with pleckstrin-like domain
MNSYREWKQLFKHGRRDTLWNMNSPAPVDHEVDVWWGSYSGWTLLPSFLACIVATAIVTWLSWALLPHELVQLTILGLGGAVWCVQLARWGLRFFGFNYRLTTRRVFADHGFIHPARDRADLGHVADVRVERTFLDRLSHVGHIQIHFKKNARPPMILEGVRQPKLVAELIQETVRRLEGNRDCKD